MSCFTLKKSAMSLLCVLGLLVPLSAKATDAAANSYFDLSPEQLLNIQVTSVSKKSQNVSDAPAAVYVITNEDILRAGVQTLPEALRMAPGVQVARADSNTWAISIRGFNGVLANKLLVMIDGRTVYNPLFAGTYWELQDLLLEDVDRIEVVRGPGGSLWGANAVNGVINIITKTAHETQGTLLTGAYGIEQPGAVQTRYGGKFGDGNSYRVSAKYFNHDDFSSPAGGSANDDWEGYRTGFRIDTNNKFTFQGAAYRVLTEQNVAVPQLAPPYAFTTAEVMDSRGAHLLAKWDDEQDNGAQTTYQTYLDYSRRDQVLLDDERLIADVDIQHNFAKNGAHEIIMGGGYRLTYDDLENTPTVNFESENRIYNLLQYFVQDKITLKPDEWFLTLGSRFELNDFTGFEVQPNARLQWHPDQSQMFWTSVSRAVRTPSRVEDDLNQTLSVSPPGVFGPGATAVVIQPNPSLESEDLIAYEAGWRKQFTPDFSFDAAVFYNDYNDYVDFGFLPTSPGTFPVSYINAGDAEAYGLELAADWNVSKDLKLSAAYSFLDIEVAIENEGGFNLDTEEEQSPHHQANLRASWNVNERLSVDPSLYYVDELPGYDVDDYVRFDINVGWKINENMRFNVIGQNLLDSEHREFGNATDLNASEIERAVFGKLTVEF